jgi:sugar lactone lactonase YvrE
MVDVRAGGAEPVSDVRAMLGEGPYWVPEDGKLLWVDAEDGLLHRTDVVSGGTESFGLDAVTAVFPALGGGVLTAGGNKLIRRFPGERRPDEVVAEAPELPGVRFNDGSVDPAGRVWVGSMHIGETEQLGTLYRLDPGCKLTPVVPGATVSNGIGWSPDGTRMYYSDSPLRRLDMFDYDPATGEAFHRRVFADLSGFDGVPDVLTVDADGYIWVAMWGGSAIRRFTPSGQLDTVLEVPVSQPSSCAFGGPGMAELYVTTARVRLSEAELAAQPLAGRLLRFRPGPIGLPSAASQAAIPS